MVAIFQKKRKITHEWNSPGWEPGTYHQKSVKGEVAKRESGDGNPPAVFGG